MIYCLNMRYLEMGLQLWVRFFWKQEWDLYFQASRKQVSSFFCLTHPPFHTRSGVGWRVYYFRTNQGRPSKTNLTSLCVNVAGNIRTDTAALPAKKQKLIAQFPVWLTFQLSHPVMVLWAKKQEQGVKWWRWEDKGMTAEATRDWQLSYRIW